MNLEIDKHADYVLSYFEDLGLILEKNLAPEYFVWTMNCYYILPYWEILTKYIDWVRKDKEDSTYYSGFEYLHKKMLMVEKRKTKKTKIEFTPNELREFLEEELQVQVRQFLLSDLDRIMEIEASSFGKAEVYPMSQFEELYKEHSEGFFVADILGEVIGYAIGYISDETGEIDSIAVYSAFRHLGIGRKLTEHVLDRFRGKGIKTCSLEVSTTNKSAVRFYQNMGFQIKETLENFYEDGGDAYLMRMDI